MKKHISFPSIEQFRNVIQSVNRHSCYVGKDVNGDAIYDSNLPKPVLTFKGTVKLHGCNSSVVYNNIDGFWVQSRENIIDINQPLYGFYTFAEKNKDWFINTIKDIAIKHNIDLDTYTISIFGEWAGPGIQKGVGISQLPQKSMFVFGVKVSNTNDEKFNAYWVDHSSIKNEDLFIYNIEDFQTFSVDIDFNMPQLIQNKLIELTLAVEEECPVAKAFGFEKTLGEGIVFSCEYKGIVYRFKSKGERHASSSKVRTLVPVDTEKLNSIVEFIEYAVTQNRFEQALSIIFPDNQEPTINKMGDVIRWVVNDIIKEESDTLIENNLNGKDVNKYISTKVRNMFNAHLDKIILNK